MQVANREEVWLPSICPNRAHFPGSGVHGQSHGILSSSTDGGLFWVEQGQRPTAPNTHQKHGDWLRHGLSIHPTFKQMWEWWMPQYQAWHQKWWPCISGYHGMWWWSGRWLNGEQGDCVVWKVDVGGGGAKESNYQTVQAWVPRVNKVREREREGAPFQ